MNTNIQIKKTGSRVGARRTGKGYHQHNKYTTENPVCQEAIFCHVCGSIDIVGTLCQHCGTDIEKYESEEYQND